MKRIFVFAVLAGAFAVPASMAQAQMGDAPAAQPNQAEIQPSERGALGGLASGAPSVAQSVQGGAAAAAPQAAQVAPQGAAPAPQAGIAQGQAPAGQGVVAQPGVAGQGAIAQTGVAGQGVVAQQGVAGQAVAGQAIAGQAGIAQTGIAAQGVVAGGQTVVGMQQSFHSQMQRHFLVQQAFQHCMFFSDFQPHVFRPVAMPIGFGGPFFAPVPGDLELISVGMVADGIADKGPMYRVIFKNHGAIAARHFRVSLIATLGRLEPTSPVISVNIDEIAPGAIANVDIQLPAGVMSLGGQPAGPFSQLIAVIDSFGELFETNKLNNVLTLTRTDITIITTTTTAVAPAAAAVAPAAGGVVAPAAGGIAPAAAAPAVGGPAAGAPAAGPAAPAAPVAPAPKGNGELDKIDLDSVSGASELLDR